MGSPRGFKVFGKETRHGAGNTWKHDAIQFRTFARQMRGWGGEDIGYYLQAGIVAVLGMHCTQGSINRDTSTVYNNFR